MYNKFATSIDFCPYGSTPKRKSPLTVKKNWEDDEPVLKLDDFPEADEDSEKEKVATDQHTKQKTNQQTQY
ncbi:hypothetical protein DAPPUDRAFT_254721 [Daphnia pulex]|uniref:Uncharacterized protein n=1 Tax=Daphnia pulex TaxID=6669 RepID=E9H7R0_DAPPU|nr:hypothetical protein DAPPUDRAFT_254721 [Daphnia pulex]|eukprot:EFX72224.1 hypothetical protein DAPPUDRAFT_254721 [Daphnia pulex]